MKNFNPVRGTYDYLPSEAKLRETIRTKILSVFQNNGYNLISTPVFEHLELLNGSDGGDNLKLMFKTIKRGDKLNLTKPDLKESDLVEEGLRYDLTVPLARFYSNNREKLPTPFKAIQIDNVFRAERPQKGRNRQFMQCDIDVFGDASINAELELLKTAIEAYQEMGFNSLTLKINDRRILNSLVLFAGFTEDEIGTVCVSLDKLDKIAVSGVVMELIEKGMEAEKINKLVDILNDVLSNGIDCVSNYGVEQKYVDDINYLINTLKELTSGHNIEFNISIVRGQGYYTGTVYEFYAEGFNGAIGGGGRYDKMVGKMTGNDVCAVGVSIGFERVALLAKENGLNLGDKENLALIYDADDNIVEVFNLKTRLMNGFNVSLYLRPKNMKSFYDKIVEVASYCISFKDYNEGKEVKKLTK